MGILRAITLDGSRCGDARAGYVSQPGDVSRPHWPILRAGAVPHLAGRMLSSPYQAP